MLAPVSDAIQRFRRRLQLATFLRGMSISCFGALALLVVALLAERFGEVELLFRLPGWAIWGGVATVALLGGALLAHRTVFEDLVVVQHLEQRLATRGLLLAASQGVALDPTYERRLLKQLATASTVLPAVRWQHLAMRPIAVALLVLVAQQLPSKMEERQASEALHVAVDRLAQEVEEIAQLDAVPDDQVEELRRAVTDLKQRAETGDNGLWREIDQLQERIDREEKLAAGDDGGAGKLGPNDGAGNGDADSELAAETGQQPVGASNQNQQPLDGVMLADAMSKLGKIDAGALESLLAKLPNDLGDAEKKAIADAIKSDGLVDPEALPDDKATLAALAGAIAETADELMSDPEAMAEWMSGMSEQQQAGMVEELAALAEQFDPAGDATGEQAEQPGEDQLKKELSEELANAAAEMAKAGALDKLPEGLRDAMAEAGLSALENMDLQQLVNLLPDDLSQLTVMAENFAKVAESMQGSGEEGQGGEGPQPSKALKEKMASLSKGLMERVGRAELGKLANQGNQGNGGNPGPPGPVGTDGGGHAALRLTEDTQGGVATTDMQLPARDPDDLPKEWVPVTIDKAEPKVGKRKAPGVGRAGASGTGGATWQLRLMPRHREVVRRFFAEKNK